MKVIVGSENRPKLMAVETSFGAAFPEAVIDVSGVSTNSGESSHPLSAEEAITGARNRIKHAMQLVPNADYYVGIEGGLLQIENRFWEIGYVMLSDSSGKNSIGLSAGIEISGKILESIRNGTELNDVLEHDFGIKSAGSTNGFYGLATDDLVTRQAAYEQGITFALAPFLHPEFYSD